MTASQGPTPRSEIPSQQPALASEIDAVITWVDGADPSHRRKLQAFLRGSGVGIQAGASPTRFNDCGEIDYCVASLLRFAPWIRTIHIVTDAQVPTLIARLKGTPFEGRVRVVDHREIFSGYLQYLPTFSSLSIESMLWRIPGLSERFIYLNDDFQIIRPVSVGDFFDGNSVVLRGKWRDSGRRRAGQRVKAALNAIFRVVGKADPASNHSAQQLTAEMVDFTRQYFQVPHCPHPMRKSTLAKHFSEWPGQLERNLSFRLRASGQFLLTGLADHLEFAAGTATVDNRLGTLRLKPAGQWLGALRRKMSKADADSEIAFACIQSLDLAGAQLRKLTFDWLDRRIGRVASLSSLA